MLAALDAPWAPVQAVAELLDDPQVMANGYIADVEADGVAYQLPTVPVQFDGQPAAAAPGARARRAHRDDPARARLHVGRDRRAAATPGSIP